MTKRTAIYCRISRDDEGLGLGVERQRSDCEAYVQRQDWFVVDTFIDNDISAYSGKPRPQYERMMRLIEDGAIDCIVAYHSDRLHRSPRELEEFIDKIEKAACEVITTSGGSYDLSTSDGRFIARSLGNIARKESEDKSRRLRRKHLELAQSGRPATHPGFGYNPDWSINATQADNLREAAQRILDGESCYSIVRDWNCRGITTQRGRAWVPSNLARTLRVPAIAGVRVHHGEVVGTGTWQPILDRAVWDQLQIILRDPLRLKHNGIRRYLLTGFVFCAVCDVKMRALPNSTGTKRYVCRPSDNGCYRTVNAEGLDSLIGEAIMERLNSPAFRRALDGSNASPSPDLTKAIEADEAALLDYADMLAAGEITRAEWLRLRDRVDVRLKRNRRALTNFVVSHQAKAKLTSIDSIADLWAAGDNDQRRAIVASLIDKITIGPGVRGLNKFRPDRVENLVWRV